MTRGNMLDEEKMLLEYQKELGAIESGDNSVVPKYQTPDGYAKYLRDRIEYIESKLRAGRGFRR